jgi:Nucleotidyltransferase of unknown function (DUF6036)
MSLEPPPEWAAFLKEVDSLLDEPVELHCIGGFAAVAAYGLPRSTNDLDYYSITPSNRVLDLEDLAGEGSALARKHRVSIHHAAIASVPENYEDRLTELYPGRYKNIRLLVIDPYDLVLSKLSRNSARDREDVQYLARTQKLEAGILRERYEKELRSCLTGPIERHNGTLDFWLRAYFPQ